MQGIEGAVNDNSGDQGVLGNGVARDEGGDLEKTCNGDQGELNGSLKADNDDTTRGDVDMPRNDGDDNQEIENDGGSPTVNDGRTASTVTAGTVW